MLRSHHTNAIDTINVELRFQLVHDFISEQNSTSLYAYLQLCPNTPQASLEAGLESRMDWAHEHQCSAPDHHEASWLLLNEGLIRSALLEYPQSYITEVSFLHRYALPAQKRAEKSMLSFPNIRAVTDVFNRHAAAFMRSFSPESPSVEGALKESPA
ncbi:MAG: hypothetical protein ACI8RZ_002061 [Myxococcota bacterium]|jgi:hypothetical protein